MKLCFYRRVWAYKFQDPLNDTLFVHDAHKHQCHASISQPQREKHNWTVVGILFYSVVLQDDNEGILRDQREPGVVHEGAHDSGHFEWLHGTHKYLV